MKKITHTKNKTELGDDDLEYMWDTPTWPQIIATLVLIGLGVAGLLAL